MSNSNRSCRQFTTEQKVALMRRHLVGKEPALQSKREKALAAKAKELEARLVKRTT